jgi:hypothetical protein
MVEFVMLLGGGRFGTSCYGASGGARPEQIFHRN